MQLISNIMCSSGYKCTQQTTIMKENSAQQQENMDHDPKQINRCLHNAQHTLLSKYQPKMPPKNILTNICSPDLLDEE